MVIVLESLAFLIACAYVAALATPHLVQAGKRDVDRILMFSLAIFACLFGSVMLLGVVSLVSGRPVVRPDAALAVAMTAALAFHFASRGRVGQATAPVQARIWPILRRPNLDLPNIVGLLVAGCFVAIAVTLIAGFPRGFEEQAYHLPSALNIIQTHTLQPWDVAYPHTFPLNASIFYAVLLQLLPERLVAASDLLFLGVLVLATYGISRVLADHRSALLAACGLAVVPVVAYSSFQPGSDVGGLAFLALATYVVCQDDLPVLRRAALAGVACGLAYGFKSLFLVSAGVLGAALVCAALLSSGSPSAKAKTAVRVFVAFSAPWLMFAGFWLLRNWQIFHNPLYPVSLSLFERLFAWSSAPDFTLAGRADTQYEWVRAPREWMVYPWVEWQRIGENFKFSSGLGAFFAATVPVSIVAAAAHVLTGVHRRSRRVIFTLLAGTLTVLGVWWVLGDRQPRYAMGVLVFACPLVAVTISVSRGVSRRIFEGLAATSILVMLLSTGLNEMLEFGRGVVYVHGYRRERFYGYPTKVDDLPAGSTILTVGPRPWHYPLAGQHLANRVISMPEAVRALTGEMGRMEPPTRLLLRQAVLQPMSVTHVFSDGVPLDVDGCITLSEVDRIDRSPVARNPMPPRVLYSVHYSPACGLGLKP